MHRNAPHSDTVTARGNGFVSDCLGRVTAAGSARSAAALRPIRQTGTIREMVGLSVRFQGLWVPVGSLCRVVRRGLSAPSQMTTTDRADGASAVLGEVIGYADGAGLLMPYGPVEGLNAGDRVECLVQVPSVPVGPGLLGRVIDGLGRPLDGRGPLAGDDPFRAARFGAAPHPLPRRRALAGEPPDPITRRRISEPVATGIRAIDGFLTCGKGQRMGIFSGAGVGKSVLLGMIARHTSADVNVVALIGERGREVRDFIDGELGPKGLARSVVVVSTSSDPAPLRVRAATVAATVADDFRDRGCDVMFLMDSVTRIALAQREIGLSAGEPPATRGYPPSVFALLPTLLERAGCAEHGTITGFYNVLVEGDDIDEPVSDAARSVLDGHIWLDRSLASRRHYPAVGVLASVSRLSPAVTSAEHRKAADRIARLLAAHTEADDLISIGAYVKGSDPEVDVAIEMRDSINAFLRQARDERAEMGGTVKDLIDLAERADRIAKEAASARAKAHPGLQRIGTPAAAGGRAK